METAASQKPRNALGSLWGYQWMPCTQIHDWHILGPLFKEKEPYKQCWMNRYIWHWLAALLQIKKMTRKNMPFAPEHQSLSYNFREYSFLRLKDKVWMQETGSLSQEKHDITVVEQAIDCGLGTDIGKCTWKPFFIYTFFFPGHAHFQNPCTPSKHVSVVNGHIIFLTINSWKDSFRPLALLSNKGNCHRDSLNLKANINLNGCLCLLLCTDHIVLRVISTCTMNLVV